MQDNILEIKNLKHSYDASKEVLKGINLDVVRGEVVSILGPSGCGKTTLLRLIAGLEKQTFGSKNINNNVDLVKVVKGSYVHTLFSKILLS